MLKEIIGLKTETNIFEQTFELCTLKCYEWYEDQEFFHAGERLSRCIVLDVALLSATTLPSNLARGFSVRVHIFCLSFSSKIYAYF